MSIAKNILELTPEELSEFVSQRRLAREAIKPGKKKRAPKSALSRLSKEFGLSKQEIIRKAKEELGL